MKAVLHWLLVLSMALAAGAGHAESKDRGIHKCKPDRKGRCFIDVTVMPPDATHPACYPVVDFETVEAPRRTARAFVWRIVNPRSEGYKFDDDVMRAIRLTRQGADQDFDDPRYDEPDEAGKRTFRLRIVGTPQARSEYEIQVERRRSGQAERCDVKDPVIAND